MIDDQPAELAKRKKRTERGREVRRGVGKKRHSLKEMKRGRKKKGEDQRGKRQHTLTYVSLEA